MFLKCVFKSIGHQTIDVAAVGDVFAALREHGIEAELSADDLVAGIARNNPPIITKAKSFLERCASLGYRVEAKKTLMLKLRVGKNINFATIYPDSGTVDTSYVYYFCEQVGRPDVAETYLRGLARIAGGEILTDGEKRTERVFVNGAPPRFDRPMADGGEQWLALLGAAASALKP